MQTQKKEAELAKDYIGASFRENLGIKGWIY